MKKLIPYVHARSLAVVHRMPWRLIKWRLTMGYPRNRIGEKTYGN